MTDIYPEFGMAIRRMAWTARGTMSTSAATSAFA
jgi:hypothetical protein